MSTDDLGLTETQRAWARRIVARIKTRGFGSDGPRIADIALATAIVESGLYMYANRDNPESLALPHDKVGSDYDSVGLYQQRPRYWGTTAQLMDVETSTDLFVDALRRLDWQGMSNGEAAQAVQVSAFPDRYAQQDAWARRIRTELWDEPSAITLTEDDDMIINIKGVKGKRRGGLYYVSGGKATFIGGRTPAKQGRYPMFTNEAEIKRLQAVITGLH